MKTGNVFLCSLTLAFGLLSLAHANNYFPSERIQCLLGNEQKISCEGFDHQFFGEDRFSGDMTSTYEIFNFQSGESQFSYDGKKATSYFYYTNTASKAVRLITENLFPDMVFGRWRMVGIGHFKCNAGYMTCTLTTVPPNVAA